MQSAQPVLTNKSERILINARLVLGTAQLGVHYGISNKTGQPDEQLAMQMVAKAHESGIRTFDTAQAYGTSESILGQSLKLLKLSHSADVITKLDPKLDHKDEKVLHEAVERSLRDLGVSRLRGLLLHRESFLDGWKTGLGRRLTSFIKKNLVEDLGVSCYSPLKALEALEYDEVRLIQVPANLWDRRCESAGVFELAAKLKKTIFIRGIFLQGFFFLKDEEIPSGIKSAAAHLQRLRELAQEFGFTIYQLALGYVLTKWPQARVIFGAEMPSQVEENCRLATTILDAGQMNRIEQTFAGVEEKILHPGLWGKA